MVDLPKRVWSGKKQVYSWKKAVWVKDWKLWVYDPNFEEVTNWQYYSPNRWGNVSADAELQIYDDKDSLNPTDIGTFEDGLESTYQFVDWDGTVLKSWKVKDWETPVAPANPTREHYTFTGWNPTVWPISKNTTYSAMYVIDKFTLTFTVNDDSYGSVSPTVIENVPYGMTIISDGNLLIIWADVVTATAETWYQFSSWETLPEERIVTENLTITATFEAITYSYANWNGWRQLRNKIRDQLPEGVNVMNINGAKKVRTAGQTSTVIGWLWGWEWDGDWEVFVAVLSNANVDVLWIAVKTEQELGWYEALQTLRDAFEMPNTKMTDAIWNQVMWWFSTTLTVTTSWWETTISDGSQSIIIDTTSHDMRYGADYYDWTDDTATEYTTIQTNWWLVDGTYQYDTGDQWSIDWNNLVASIKAKWVVNATITHDTVNGEITMANGQWSFTIMDKNLWASVVYEDGDTLSEANCGKYYQWGNNYWFDGIWWNNPTVSSTQVDTTGYWPWNYYTGTDFIWWTGISDWSNPSNNNLWGDTTDTEGARQWPCPSGFHIPTIEELQNFVKMYKAIRPNISEGAEFFRDFKFCTSWYRSYYNGTLSDINLRLRLRSSSVWEEGAVYAKSLSVYVGGWEIFTFDDRFKTQAPSIRPFKNSTPPL